MDVDCLTSVLGDLAAWRFTVSRSSMTVKRGNADTPFLVWENTTPGAYGGGKCVGKFVTREDAEAFATSKRVNFITIEREKILGGSREARETDDREGA